MSDDDEDSDYRVVQLTADSPQKRDDYEFTMSVTNSTISTRSTETKSVSEKSLISDLGLAGFNPAKGNLGLLYY